jgi:hypothetical protein
MKLFDFILVQSKYSIKAESYSAFNKKKSVFAQFNFGVWRYCASELSSKQWTNTSAKSYRVIRYPSYNNSTSF